MLTLVFSMLDVLRLIIAITTRSAQRAHTSAKAKSAEGDNFSRGVNLSRGKYTAANPQKLISSSLA